MIKACNIYLVELINPFEKRQNQLRNTLKAINTSKVGKYMHKSNFLKKKFENMGNI
jgi:hypothetical protein